jgi:cytochrome c oxidase subunit 2
VLVALVVVLVVVLAACGGSKTPNSLDPSGSEADRVAGLWWLAFGVAAAVYVIVGGLVVFGSLRKGGGELDEARRRRERIAIVTGGVAIPFVILLFFAVVTVNATANLRKTAPRAVKVEVTGKRWWWDVRYPTYGAHDANEIHLPVNQPVNFTLKAADVIHSFWVPQLAGKEDMIPGQPNHLSFTPKKIGRFYGLCAEYCGVEHARMHLYVFVESAADFTRWVTQHQQPSSIPGNEEEALGQQVFVREACSGCHEVEGTEANGHVGPTLTHFGTRASIASATLENTPANLRRWIAHPHRVKPGNLMPRIPMSTRDLDALVAYLESLK